MSKTMENLAQAFAGESQANRKYLAYAKQADKEGYPQVARLFRAAAMAETVHAHAHLAAMKGVGATIENLQAAISGETREFEKMYPPMIEQARAEGNRDAERSFTYANEVERIHAALYEKARGALGANMAADYHVCSVCGNTIESEPDGPCEVCGASKQAFQRVE